MHITLFLIVQMEQHAFLKICILQKISTIYMESSFDLKDDMEWKAHRLSPIVQVYAIWTSVDVVASCRLIHLYPSCINLEKYKHLLLI